MQTSILNPVSCYGVGVHSGKVTQLTLKPAKENTGIVFIRTDITSENNFIEASYLNVTDTLLSTSISNSAGIQVSTIEHLMAALWGCEIDNVIVEVDGSEVPVMDGSSKAFVFMIECSGKKLQNAPKKHLKILKETKIINKDSEIIVSPFNSMRVDLTIDFNDKVIGKQNFVFSDKEFFKNNIADARTFGFVHELEYLRSKGLAKGASLDNAIGIECDVILNHNGLRYSDEFVRHKLLDLLGDFYTIGGNMIGSIIGYKTGHTINNQFLRQLFSDPYAYQWVSTEDLKP